MCVTPLPIDHNGSAERRSHSHQQLSCLVLQIREAVGAWRRHTALSVGCEATDAKRLKTGEASAAEGSDADVPDEADLGDATRKGLAEVEAAAVRAMETAKAKKAVEKKKKVRRLLRKRGELRLRARRSRFGAESASSASRRVPKLGTAQSITRRGPSTPARLARRSASSVFVGSTILSAHQSGEAQSQRQKIGRQR